MMLSTLLRASLDGAILVGVVWVVCGTVRQLSPATRTVLWWCAAAKFVVALAWVAPVSVPVLPPTGGPELRVTTSGDPQRTVQPSGSAHHTSDAAPMSTASGAGAGRKWTVALIAAWAAGFALAGALGLRRWRQAMSFVARSVPATESIQAMAAELAARLGLRHVPRVQSSECVDTPLVTGLLRTVVLVPGDRFAALSPRQQRLALCHELAHVKRRDLWLGCAPALAERVFFFHPLVHLATREYALWREAACDAAVIDTLNASPQEYGQLLLDLGVTRVPTRLSAAGASWSFSSLKRRISMLRQPAPRRVGSRVLAAAGVLLAIGALVPLQLTARARPGLSVNESGPAPAMGIVAPTPVADPPAEVGPVEGSETIRSMAQQTDRESRLTYVMFVNDHGSMMSGSSGDMAHARQFRKAKERLLWFRLEGREYLVRDPAVLDAIEAVWKPVGELGEQQGRLGTKQGELGTRQGEFGTKQGELGTQQGNLGGRQGALGTRQGVMASRAVGASAAEREAYERESRDIELKMRELDREMSQLNEKMREFEKPMRDLGAQMEELGREMEVIGRKMEDAARKAEGEMRALLERSIANGSATPAK